MIHCIVVVKSFLIKIRLRKDELCHWLTDKRINGWVHHETRTHIAQDLADTYFRLLHLIIKDLLELKIGKVILTN